MYVTVAEADQIVATYYMATDENRIRWEALSDADKTSALQSAFLSLEQLPYTGIPTTPDSDAFPRWPSTEVPEQVKTAYTLEAVIRTDPSAIAAEQQYGSMLQWGVSSYSIGRYSESFSKGGTSTIPAENIARAYAVSLTALRLLMAWLGGRYRIV